MTVLIAVLAVGAGSLAFRIGPLLGADRIPEALTRAAGWAGLAMLAALVVRTVLHHQDPTLPAGPFAAPLVAAGAVAVCLLLVRRGRNLLVAVAAGGTTYVAVEALTSLL